MMAWTIIFTIAILINFVSNRIINTNCKYIYQGLIVVIIAALLGMSGYSVAAGILAVIGAIIVVYGAWRKSKSMYDTHA